MKVFLTFIALLFSSAAFAQVRQPDLVSLKCIGGSSFDGVVSQVVRTIDGGFIVGLNRQVSSKTS